MARVQSFDALRVAQFVATVIAVLLFCTLAVGWTWGIPSYLFETGAILCVLHIGLTVLFRKMRHEDAPLPETE